MTHRIFTPPRPSQGFPRARGGKTNLGRVVFLLENSMEMKQHRPSELFTLADDLLTLESRPISM